MTLRRRSTGTGGGPTISCATDGSSSGSHGGTSVTVRRTSSKPLPPPVNSAATAPPERGSGSKAAAYGTAFLAHEVEWRDAARVRRAGVRLVGDSWHHRGDL